MISIEYKIIFEVRFLHDYYLYGTEPKNGAEAGSDAEMKSFFAMSAEKQTARLAELVKSGRYDMRKDLQLIIGAKDEHLFRSQRMKLVRTATGFYLGIQVSRIASGNGEIRFRPAVPLLEDASVTVGLSIANPYFGAITNLRLDRDVDSTYFFSNEGTHDELCLAAPISQLVPGQRYRMGDLAIVAGSVKQAIADNTGNPNFWSAVVGKGIVNQADRSLDVQDDWYRDWRSTVRLRSKHPSGLIKITLKNGNGRLSPIDENELLTTRLRSIITREASSV